MKKKCLFNIKSRSAIRYVFIMLVLSLFSFASHAQTFYTETFDGTSCAAGSGCDPSLVAWTTTALAGNGGAANKFYVSCQEMGNAAGVCGSACAAGTGDQSLHVGNVAASSAAAFFCPTGDCGAAFDDSSPAEATNKRCESPTISCVGHSNITIAFNYIEQGGSVVDPGDNGSLWYFDGATWTMINNLAATVNGACSPQGKWTAFSMTLPASADGNANVKIGFVWTNNGDGNADDPSFAVDDITLTASVAVNTITTGTIIGSPFCACSTVNVPFISTGTFTAGNTYTAQLSNAAGSFAAPTTIGTLVSTANAGTIACTIPCATPTGAGYRIRVISSTPAVTGTDNGVNITINATVTPSVTIAAVPAGAICAGTSVTFTATPTNGGAAPTYQWQINGTNVGGATSSTFTSTTLANGNVVTVIMTSNATCPSPATATSNSITMTVNPVVVPSVVITSSPSPATICAGDPVTFTATPTNGGAGPTYQWQVNGVNVGGATASTFTSSTLTNGNVVTVIMTSNATCASPATATSNSITVTVTAAATASVSITSSPSPATICAGDPVTFTATPTNGGATPTYQWQVNGTNVGGATASTFTSSTLVNGDVVTVIMTSSSSCATGSPATSNSITITVSAAAVASVSIAASPVSPICAGTSVTFTATPTNGGATPTYQWQINGTNVGGATSATFTTTTLANGDAVTVIMTSSSSCATGSPATSNTITMTVNPSVAASVNITSSPSPATICAGDPVTFTATPTNGGTTPTYQWQVNGTNVGGATSSTFTSTTLANGDNVTVIMTSNAACATGSPATSNTITITVTAAAPASVSVTSSPVSPICVGQSVTFTATPTNGGATPTYQWQVNGTNVAGATSSTFTTTTLANGDVVTVIMTSSSSCATSSPATSPGLTMVVNSSVTPSVTINAVPSGTICSGQSVTFTATPANGGTAPTYQWQINGTNVGGATAATFTSTTLANGDVVTVILTSNAPCASPTTATSNSITMVVTNSVTPSVTIVGAPTTICSGDPVTFTATPTNGGTTPSYQWQVNGTNAGTNSSTFTTTTLTNGAVVTVILTSNAPCASPTTATSNSVVITVNNCNPPVANFSATPTTMCQAGCSQFTDLSTNSPTSWSWSFPGGTPSTSTTQNPNVCYSANGSYDVTLIATNASGSDTLTMTGYITVGAPVSVSISGNLLITSCESTELTASPSDGTYSWGPNVNLSSTSGVTVTVEPPTTQDYWVTYTSPDGCTDSDTTTVVVEDINTYFLPTALSPHCGCDNAMIHLHGRGIDYFTLRIFDRVGEKVFETSDLEQGWDGKLHGVPMNDGVFVYRLEITFCNGETVKKHGDITLVK